MANSQLIQGAGKVARAKVAGGTIGSRAATETARFLAEGTGKVIQKRNREFNKIMNDTLNQEGLTDEEYQKTYEQLKRMRVGYVYLNKKDRMDLERQLIDNSNKKKENDRIKEEIIEDIQDEDLPLDQLPTAVEKIITRGDYAASRDELEEFVVPGPNGENLLKSYAAAWDDGRFKVSKDGKFKTDKFGNRYTNDEAGEAEFTRNAKLYWIRKARETGNKILHYNSTTMKREFLTPDEAEALLKDTSQNVTMEEIRDHIRGRKKKQGQTKLINDNIESGKVKAQNVKEGDDYKFNIREAKSRYRKIIKEGDMLELAMTPQVGKTSFQQDLTEKLMDTTYEELGITQTLVKKLDPTKDGKVSKEDANSIVTKILENENILPGYLENYFTLYEKRAYETNLADKYKTETGQQIEEMSTDEIKKLGRNLTEREINQLTKKQKIELGIVTKQGFGYYRNPKYKALDSDDNPDEFN